MGKPAARELPFGLHRLRGLPHHRSRVVVWMLDTLFHFMGWVWGFVALGILASGIVQSLLETGTLGLSDAGNWWIVLRASEHPIVTGALAAMLVLVTLFGAIAHVTVAHEEPRADTGDELAAVPVRQIDLRDLRFKLGADPNPAYFARASLGQASELLGKAAQAGAEGRFGVVLVGIPMVGKSRLALASLERALPDFELLVWPHLWPGRDTAALLATLERFKGRRIALLLDDLQEYARQNEAAFVLTAIARLRALCRPLVVVATARTGADQQAVEREFGSLLEHSYTLSLEPMDPSGAEAQEFLRTMAAAGAEVHGKSFDGTPGSALLDLDRRTELLRARAFAAGALAILEALALLRRAQTYTYPESRARRVAQGVFGLAGDEAAWTRALGALLDDGWVRLERASGAGESALRLPTDAYLDVCLAVRYPLAGRRIEDDFPRLLEALSGAPADADALFGLAEALREDPLGDKAAQGELALRAVKTGLGALDPARDSQRWASGQDTLGNIYATRILSERAENLERAIAAYEQALTVRTQEAFPVDWATTQNNLGSAYADRIRGERGENLERAIAAYEQALTVRTQEAFPVQWAMTSYNVALLRAAQSVEARARGDVAGCRAFQAAALEAMRSTLAVYTPEGFPDDSADAVRQIARIEALGCGDEQGEAGGGAAGAVSS